MRRAEDFGDAERRGHRHGRHTDAERCRHGQEIAQDQRAIAVERHPECHRGGAEQEMDELRAGEISPGSACRTRPAAPPRMATEIMTGLTSGLRPESRAKPSAASHTRSVTVSQKSGVADR